MLKQQRCDIFLENKVDTHLGFGRKCVNLENEGSPKRVDFNNFYQAKIYYT